MKWSDCRGRFGSDAVWASPADRGPFCALAPTAHQRPSEGLIRTLIENRRLPECDHEPDRVHKRMRTSHSKVYADTA